MSFLDINLHPDLVRAVEALGWTDPTPIQRQAVPLILEGRDVLGAAQTGSGKTGAFALPILDHLLRKPSPGLRLLVLVPTRELASQVEQTFRDVGRFTSFKVATVIGGVGYDQQRRAVSEGAEIMVATPGRLLDHLENRAFRLTTVDHLVMDEADRMLDMGFLPDIRAILHYVPKERQTLLFSATLVPDVERVAAFTLKDPVRVEVARPATLAEGISQVLYPVVQEQKIDLLLTLLKNTEMRSVLAFTRTKDRADRLAASLDKAGYRVEVLHSNRTQRERTDAMENFREGKSQILVATDIAARGIDVKGISHVINFDVPQHPEDYVHRVGRTARAYGVGDAITLMDPVEQVHVTDIERFTGLTFPRAMLPNFPYKVTPKLEGPKPVSGWQRIFAGRNRPLRRSR
ncbi:MAG TPA: DEAD/DEAH box helicase [Elusimicrobiota bacterium]|jgi:ATP-dependent RNA helicase RhlE|nr:DEAD/DEAH box helicase [Elusimicrobiota bacterium]HMX93964.1 DEAD/DEAH box helicase [Elusimicrobiota bacterium]HMZ26681.1 DEAD/DEAH box helicase [Elusimicrobiota bacterium]HNA60429.1 DEAD/DEAH box helicase [Elusimicrobiota bacterium]HND63251.1 DEAD/DEAH box helicase [Elusimicrobiota bacterium]